MSVVSQFITVASFSFSDVEDSLTEAKELVSQCNSRLGLSSSRRLKPSICVSVVGTVVSLAKNNRFSTKLRNVLFLLLKISCFLQTTQAVL